MTTLSLRALNRATLERQLLLRRWPMSPVEVVERLVALQAQEPNAPYISLWSRLESFQQDELTKLLYDKQVVRSSLLRATQHMALTEDYLWLRPLVQPALDRARQAGFGRVIKGIDLDELAAAGRSLLEGRTLTRPQIAKLLAERYPDCEPLALGWSIQTLVPVVHQPPNGTWGKLGATPFTLAEEWLGRSLTEEPPVTDLILRYLAAFGPASVKDVQLWSGLTRLSEHVERLRPRLRTFRDEAGVELFDLPGAPLPDPDTPAPVRFMPTIDNLIIGHADRRRFLSDDYRKRVIIGSAVEAVFLVDGFVRGVWTLKSDKGKDKAGGTTTLLIEQYEELAEADQAAVAEEGARLLAFAAPDADTHDLRFVPPGAP